MAHTANDAVDVVDCQRDEYVRSISQLPGVAGVLASNEKDLVFTSNRGETTVGVFTHGRDSSLEKMLVGGSPNGLAFDPSRDMLVAANVGKPDGAGSVTVSVVDVKRRVMVADVMVPGRTRWTVFDPKADRFYVNINEPSQIAILDSRDPDGILRSYEIPAKGPHGLDLDVEGRRLFCACDEGGLFTISLESGKVSRVGGLSGPPDVIFYNSRFQHLYVAIGDPGAIEIFDTRAMGRIQTVRTELGTHTIAFNPDAQRVYAFMPDTHRASVYVDG